MDSAKSVPGPQSILDVYESHDEMMASAPSPPIVLRDEIMEDDKHVPVEVKKTRPRIKSASVPRTKKKTDDDTKRVAKEKDKKKGEDTRTKAKTGTVRKARKKKEETKNDQHPTQKKISQKKGRTNEKKEGLSLQLTEKISRSKERARAAIRNREKTTRNMAGERTKASLHKLDIDTLRKATKNEKREHDKRLRLKLLSEKRTKSEIAEPHTTRDILAIPTNVITGANVSTNMEAVSGDLWDDIDNKRKIGEVFGKVMDANKKVPREKVLIENEKISLANSEDETPGKANERLLDQIKDLENRIKQVERSSTTGEGQIQFLDTGGNTNRDLGVTTNTEMRAEKVLGESISIEEEVRHRELQLENENLKKQLLLANSKGNEILENNLKYSERIRALEKEIEQMERSEDANKKMIDRLTSKLSNLKQKVESCDRGNDENMEIVLYDQSTRDMEHPTDALQLARTLALSNEQMFGKLFADMNAQNLNLVGSIVEAVDNRLQMESKRQDEQMKALKESVSDFRRFEKKMAADSATNMEILRDISMDITGVKTTESELTKVIHDMKRKDFRSFEIETEQAKEDEKLAVEILVLLLKQTFDLFFAIKLEIEKVRSSVANATILEIEAILSEVRLYLQSSSFSKVMTNIAGVNIQFLTPEGDYVYDDFGSAADSHGVSVITKISLQHAISYASRDEAVDYRLRLLSIIAPALKTSVYDKLQSARRLLVDTLHQEESQRSLGEAMERQSLVYLSDRLKLILNQLSRALKQKAIPSIEDVNAEKGTMHYVLRRNLIANTSICENIEIILSFSESYTSFPQSLVSDFRKLLSFVNGKPMDPTSGLEDTRMDINDSWNEKITFSAFERIEEAASKILSAIDDMHSRALVESGCKFAERDHAGEGSGEKVHSIIDVVKTLLEEAKNATEQALKDGVKCQCFNAEQIQERLLAIQSQTEILPELQRQVMATRPASTGGANNDTGGVVDASTRSAIILSGGSMISGGGVTNGGGQASTAPDNVSKRRAGGDEGNIRKEIGVPDNDRGDDDRRDDNGNGQRRKRPMGDECLSKLAMRMSNDYKIGTLKWVTDQIEVLEKSLNDDEKGRTLNRFLASHGEAISGKAIQMFQGFTQEAVRECKVTTVNALIPYLNILIETKRETEREIASKISKLLKSMNASIPRDQQLRQVDKRVTEREIVKILNQETEEEDEESKIRMLLSEALKFLIASKQAMDEEPMDTDEYKSPDLQLDFEIKRKKAMANLRETVDWAVQMSRAIVDNEIPQEKKIREMIANLEGKGGTIRMEAIDLTKKDSINVSQKWDGHEKASRSTQQYNSEEPIVHKMITEMNRAFVESAVPGATQSARPEMRMVKQVGVTLQNFAYGLSYLSLIMSDTDKGLTFVHPLSMRKALKSEGGGHFEFRHSAIETESVLRSLACNLMNTLRDNNVSNRANSTSCGGKYLGIPWMLNMLIYNIFAIDAKIIKEISCVSFKFREFLRTTMKNRPVSDMQIRAQLMEATVTSLYTACKKLLMFILKNDNLLLPLTRKLEHQLATMLSGGPQSDHGMRIGDAFRTRVCLAMHDYLSQYLFMCSRRINTCMATLTSTDLTSKKIMAAPTVGHGMGSSRVSSYDIKFDFSVLHKLLKFQARNISLLRDLAFKSWESVLAVLAAFTVIEPELPIWDSTQKSLISLAGDEVVLAGAEDSEEDVIHAEWCLEALIELNRLLTQYTAWLSKNDLDDNEEEKMIRICRDAAGVATACFRLLPKEETDQKLIDVLLAPARKQKSGAEAAIAASEALYLIQKKVTNAQMVKFEKRRKNSSLMEQGVGSILVGSSAIQPGSMSISALTSLCDFDSRLHTSTDFWGTSVFFPVDGSGTDLEGWIRTYDKNSSQDTLLDFSDLTLESNFPLWKLLIPPDFGLNTLMGKAGLIGDVRGVNYRIQIRDGQPPNWQHRGDVFGRVGASRHQLPGNEDNIFLEGTILCMKPADGVTLTLGKEGRGLLRRVALLRNALKNTNISYTRPIFNVQDQSNNHFETPQIVLLPFQHRWTSTTTTTVKASVWSLPSIRLVYKELVHKNDVNAKKGVDDKNGIITDNADINRAIGNIIACCSTMGARGIDVNGGNSSSTLQITPTAGVDNASIAISSVVDSIMSNPKYTTVTRNDKNDGRKFCAVDELTLPPALLARSGTAPYRPAASKVCGMFASYGNIIRKSSKGDFELSTPWWTSDPQVLVETAEAAENMVVLTPSLLDIQPPVPLKRRCA
nr:MAG: wsv143-like protein [Metapenaeus ensis nimavirus]